MNNEFSRVYNLQELAESGKTLVLEANQAERKAIASRLGIEDVSALKASIRVTKEGPGLYEVAGQVEGEVTQRCVRTLEPVRSKVADPFSTTYMEESVFAGLDAEDRDDRIEDIEVLDSEEVDLGELVTQYLSLSLDPYPVAEGVEPDYGNRKGVNIYSEMTIRDEKNPFAKLKKLHKKG